MITLNSTFVVIIVGTLIPILVGVMTKLDASPRIKSIINIVLNGVQALIVSSVTADGAAAISKQTAVLWALGVITSIATYLGVWKPNNIPQKLLPNVGIGGSSENPPVTVVGDGSSMENPPA